MQVSLVCSRSYVYRAGRQRDPIFVDRSLKRVWLAGRLSWYRACGCDEDHSALNALLLYCERTVRPRAVRLLPYLGGSLMAAPHFLLTGTA